jgi:hypothetical protein
MKLSTLSVALMAVFAALYYVLSIFTPHVPAIGNANIKISLEALIASIFGLVLGPYMGALTALVGASVALVLPPGVPTPYDVPFLLAPPINALVVGLIYYRKWKAAFAAFGALIVVFLFLPPSQPLFQNAYVGIAVIWDKLIALFLIVPAVMVARKPLSRRQAAGLASVVFTVVVIFALYGALQPAFLDTILILIFAVLAAGIILIFTVFTVYGAVLRRKAVSIGLLYFLLAFIGNQADNMWGADIFAVPIVYEGIYGLPVEVVRFLFVVSPLVYPAIRFLQAIIATAIAVPLMKALKNIGWFSQEETIESGSEVIQQKTNQDIT